MQRAFSIAGQINALALHCSNTDLDQTQVLKSCQPGVAAMKVRMTIAGFTGCICASLMMLACANPPQLANGNADGTSATGVESNASPIQAGGGESTPATSAPAGNSASANASGEQKPQVVYVDRIVEVPVETIKEVRVEVPVETIKEVPFEVIKEVPVEVIRYEVPARDSAEWQAFIEKLSLERSNEIYIAKALTLLAKKPEDLQQVDIRVMMELVSLFATRALSQKESEDGKVADREPLDWLKGADIMMAELEKQPEGRVNRDWLLTQRATLNLAAREYHQALTDLKRAAELTLERVPLELSQVYFADLLKDSQTGLYKQRVNNIFDRGGSIKVSTLFRYASGRKQSGIVSSGKATQYLYYMKMELELKNSKGELVPEFGRNGVYVAEGAPFTSTRTPEELEAISSPNALALPFNMEAGEYTMTVRLHDLYGKVQREQNLSLTIKQ